MTPEQSVTRGEIPSQDLQEQDTQGACALCTAYHLPKPNVTEPVARQTQMAAMHNCNKCDPM